MRVGFRRNWPDRRLSKVVDSEHCQVVPVGQVVRESRLGQVVQVDRADQAEEVVVVDRAAVVAELRERRKRYLRCKNLKIIL